MEQPKRDPLLPPGKKETPKEPNTALKIAVLVGLIILLVIGVLLPIRLIPRASTSAREFFSSIFTRKPRAEVTVNKTQVATGESFTISWTGEALEGSYVLSYVCEPGLSLETTSLEPGYRITCGESYNFVPEDNFIVLTPYSEAARMTEAAITLSFMPDESSRARELGEVTVRVINTDIPDPAAEPIEPVATTTPPREEPAAPARPATSTPATRPSATQTTPRVPAVRPSNPNGIADLGIAILGTGYINRSTGAFVQSQQLTRDMAVAVQFIVTNNGDKNTGPWGFSASLPSKTNPAYNAFNLANLAPSQSTIFTLGFEGIETGTKAITISLDPAQQIPELNEMNNAAAATVVTY